MHFTFIECKEISVNAGSTSSAATKRSKDGQMTLKVKFTNSIYGLYHNKCHY